MCDILHWFNVFQGSLTGAVTGVTVCLWWGLGAIVSGKRPTTLPLRIDGCVTENSTWVNVPESSTSYVSPSMTSPNTTFVSPTSGYTLHPSDGQGDRYVNYGSVFFLP